MIKIIRSDEAIRREATDGYIVNNFITKEISPNMSLAVAEAQNLSHKENTNYDRIYYILNGQLDIETNGEKMVVKAGDSAYLSAGENYKMSGSFAAIIVNSPAYGTKNLSM